MIDVIGVDLGKYGAISFWTENRCVAVEPWYFDDKKYMCENLTNIFEKFKFAVDQSKVVCTEKISRQLAQQWILYTDLRGYTLEFKDKKFVSYVPSSIKKEVTGSGKGTKDDVEKAVLASGCLDKKVKPEGEHSFDSVAIALCYLKKENLYGKASGKTPE